MGVHGYHGASVSAICRLSGYPSGSLYHHFGSKNGLLLAVLERGVRRVEMAVRGALADNDDPVSRLYAFFDVITVTVAEHPRFHRLLAHMLVDDDPEVQAIVAPFRRRQLENGHDCVAMAFECLGRSVDHAEVAEVVAMVSSLIAGQFSLQVPGQRERVVRLLDALLTTDDRVRHQGVSRMTEQRLLRSQTRK